MPLSRHSVRACGQDHPVRRRSAVLGGLILVPFAVAGVVWMSGRDGDSDGLETCEDPSECADVLDESGPRPLVPRADDRFAFVSGDVSRSDERPLGTMLL